ncbi:hypothetical protein [Sphaerisporangium fuscum]|uniref:hypothetical protein n=1 Tax=Sphaerisporangium fuscum TaxID=2835868 RepID=UPI001BDD2753|nr:hypothetical protein [Sphaerisporangium fuscum]
MAGLGGLLAVGGCTTPARPTFGSTDERGSDEPGTQELQAILDRRAKAVRDKNEQAFLADLDASNTRLVRQEKLLFANLTQFELRDFHFITERIIGAAGGGNTYTFTPVIAVTQLTADVGPGGVGWRRRRRSSTGWPRRATGWWSLTSGGPRGPAPRRTR